MNIEEEIRIIRKGPNLSFSDSPEKMEEKLHRREIAMENLITVYKEQEESATKYLSEIGELRTKNKFLDNELYNANLEIQNLQLSIAKEKEKNKELTDKLKDCDLHYSKLYKFHNNNCVTKDRINQIINELIELYFEEDGYCFNGFMFNKKSFNSLNIKEEMTVMQLLKYLQKLLKEE